jgi:hypothetical protein
MPRIKTELSNENVASEHVPGVPVNRRVAMNMIVGTAVAGAAVTAQADASLDPIFAAIEAHAAVNVAMHACIKEHSALERELPMDRQKSSITGWEEKIVETDDPRWIDAERRLYALNGAEIDASMELISVEPTTLAGVAALLKHVATIEAKGWDWPSDLKEDDAKPPVLGKKWEVFLHRNLAATLSAIVA